MLRAEDRVELVHGEILDMSPIGKEHSGVVDFLAAFFHSIGKGETIVRVQSSILLDDRSEPQPDLAILHFRADYYRKELPQAQDVLMVIEVSDSSIEFDLGLKAALYATAEIREYWVVDLRRRVLRVHREPVSGQYQIVREIPRADTVAALAFPAHSLRLDELFLD